MRFLREQVFQEAIFFPQKTWFPDATVIKIGRTRLACYRHEINDGDRTVVYFHGNAECVGQMARYLGRLFAACHLNLFLVEYPGYSHSSGTPSLELILKHAAKILRCLGLDPQRVIIWGRSLGCFPALRTAEAHPDIFGLVLESSAGSYESYRSRVCSRIPGDHRKSLSEAFPSELSVSVTLQRCAARKLFLSSSNDPVSISAAMELHALASEPKRAVFLPYGTHNSLMSANLEEVIFEIESLAHEKKYPSSPFVK